MARKTQTKTKSIVTRRFKVHGTVLRQLIILKGLQHTQLSKNIGVTRHRISALSKPGTVHYIRSDTAKKFANGLGVSLAKLGAQSLEQENDLSEDEMVMLDYYRQLDPVGRAEALLRMKKIVEDDDEASQS